jgi:prefoldin subunit 5
MKTIQEIKDELNELYGAIMALSQAMTTIHEQQTEKTKQMFALNQMLKDMQEKKDD